MLPVQPTNEQPINIDFDMDRRGVVDDFMVKCPYASRYFDRGRLFGQYNWPIGETCVHVVILTPEGWLQQQVLASLPFVTHLCENFVYGKHCTLCLVF